MVEPVVYAYMEDSEMEEREQEGEEVSTFTTFSLVYIVVFDTLSDTEYRYL